MQRLGFKYIPQAMLCLKASELHRLSIAATEHYDGYCQSIAQQGGFLYGWLNMLHMGVGREGTYSINVCATGHQIDTLVKVLENEPDAFALYSDLKHVLRDLGEEFARVNA